MKHPRFWLAAILLLAACHRPVQPQELPGVAWRPLDNLFACYLEKEGSQPLTSSKRLEIEYIGSIDRQTRHFMPAAITDTAQTALAMEIGETFGKRALLGKINQGTDGYLKGDFSRLFPDDSVIVTVYIKEHHDQAEIDTLQQTASRMPEVAEVHYTSKEEARKKFIADGNADFSAVLDANPLPASIELMIRKPFYNAKALSELKERLQMEAGEIISEVMLPDERNLELRQLAERDCIFRFKS